MNSSTRVSGGATVFAALLMMTGCHGIQWGGDVAPLSLWDFSTPQNSRQTEQLLRRYDFSQPRTRTFPDRLAPTRATSRAGE